MILFFNFYLEKYHFTYDGNFILKSRVINRERRIKNQEIIFNIFNLNKNYFLFKLNIIYYLLYIFIFIFKY